MISLSKPARACRPGQKADREEIQECASIPVCMSTSASQGGGLGESAGEPGDSTNLRPYIADVYSFANMAKYSSSPNSRYACICSSVKNLGAGKGCISHAKHSNTQPGMTHLCSKLQTSDVLRRMPHWSPATNTRKSKHGRWCRCPTGMHQMHPVTMCTQINSCLAML